MASSRTTGHPATVIDMLEREWEVLARLPAGVEALRRWGRGDEAMAPFDSLAYVVSYVHDRSNAAADTRCVLAALAARSAIDELAARTLLQLLLPGCKALVARYAWVSESVDECAATVVGDVYERIRAFPAGERPRWVTTVVLGAARKRLLRRAERSGREVGLDEARASEALAREAPQPSAADELAEILAWASEEGHVSRDEADLIAKTRLEHIPVAQLCKGNGERPEVLRRRRLRAEARLKAALAAA